MEKYRIRKLYKNIRLNITNREEKENLIQESYKYLESKSIEKTPISLFKDKIVENLRKDKQEGVALVTSFNVKENIRVRRNVND